MSTEPGVGFERDVPPTAAPKRLGAPVELIATVLLLLSTLVAVTVVSIGIARAEGLGSRADFDAAPLAIALFIGLLFAAMGGLTAIAAHDRRAE